MYSFFKNIYKILIPKSWQFKIEPFIRKIVYNLIYKGGKTICLICSAKSKKFIPISFNSSDDKICPNCGALSRSRALGEYVSKKNEYERKYGKCSKTVSLRKNAVSRSERRNLS